MTSMPAHGWSTGARPAAPPPPDRAAREPRAGQGTAAPGGGAGDWAQRSRDALLAAIEGLRPRLEPDPPACAHERPGPGTATLEGQGAPVPAEPDAAAPRRQAGAPGCALDALCALLGLDGFERDLLVLCAGVELDGDLAGAVARAGGGDHRPSFGLALSLLPGAHWSATAPEAALRGWRLVEIDPGHRLVGAPLHIDERVLQYLLGLPGRDERLRPLLRDLSFEESLLAPAQLAVAERIASLWSLGAAASAIQLVGHDADARRRVAAAACAGLGLALCTLDAAELPAAAADREALARLCLREALLDGSALLVEVGEETAPRPVARFVGDMGALAIVGCREPLRAAGLEAVVLDVPRATREEQRALWARALGERSGALEAAVAQASAQFDLGTDEILRAARQLRLAAGESRPEQGGAADGQAARLWALCRAEARRPVEALVERVEPRARWEDIVLPPAQLEQLREIAVQARQRARVLDEWGFAERLSRGLGLGVLFAGPSGTGKTLAAEVLAGDLRLDLYRVDLSQVVSKYIGETEKNLARVFDAAEHGGAVLLFDEADALFGKRSEVKDSHDRYANIEVSYLLQRMEAYRGLAILTTNQRKALDEAFMRRLRFVVSFPFPGTAQRAEIWRRVFPPRTPLEPLELGRLAQLDVAGGHIRNMALNAAFLAAHEEARVGMRHVLRAARSEYAKLERPLSEAETRGMDPRGDPPAGVASRRRPT